jgi:hypothetical protein
MPSDSGWTAAKSMPEMGATRPKKSGNNKILKNYLY